MSAYVIADLHLSTSTPELLSGFAAFVNTLQPGDELYILGDLFNFFVGLDKYNNAQKLVSYVLKEAALRSITAYFIKGNRDFLMNAAEAKSLGLILLDDIALVKIANKSILLSHGDLFCTNDEGYKRYYRLVNNKILQRLFKLLPMCLRRKIATRIRQQSKESHFHRRDPLIYGVVPNSVASKAQELLANKAQQDPQNWQGFTKVDYVVHGHIHEFKAFHNESAMVDTRYVLGAWGNKFSYWAIDQDGNVSFSEQDLILLA